MTTTVVTISREVNQENIPLICSLQMILSKKTMGITMTPHHRIMLLTTKMKMKIKVARVLNLHIKVNLFLLKILLDLTINLKWLIKLRTSTCWNNKLSNQKFNNIDLSQGYHLPMICYRPLMKSYIATKKSSHTTK